MDYQTWILTKLIAKYENSGAFADGNYSRKITVRMKDEGELCEKLESAEEKEDFLGTLRTLKYKGIIDYSWVKFEKGNLVDRIWLIVQDDELLKCYKLLGISPKKDVLKCLSDMLAEFQEKIQTGAEASETAAGISGFLTEMESWINSKHKIPRFFSEDLELDRDILKILAMSANSESEVLERVLSVNLYGDSKHFEKQVKGKLVSVLRWCKAKTGEEMPPDEELLREVGIVKWPEILEFSGDIRVTLEDGQRIEYAAHRYGAYINSQTVKAVRQVDMVNIKQVTLIENKANYVWYLSQEKTADELVLYHGGCYSPVKGLWFRKIYESSASVRPPVEFRHWSDIDAGGFRIFTRLKQNIIPTLTPYRMDKETLCTYRNKAMAIGDSSYRRLLETMGLDPQYAEFGEVIGEMLEQDIRLEQENIL